MPRLFKEEKEKAAEMLGTERVASGKLEIAARLFDQMVKDENFKDFLTLDSYNEL